MKIHDMKHNGWTQVETRTNPERESEAVYLKEETIVNTTKVFNFIQECAASKKLYKKLTDQNVPQVKYPKNPPRVGIEIYIFKLGFRTLEEYRRRAIPNFRAACHEV